MGDWGGVGQWSTKRTSKGRLCNGRDGEARAGGWKTLWAAAAESARRCWLREAATCTVLKGLGAGGKPRLPEEVGPYATNPPKTNKQNTFGLDSEVFVMKEEAQAMEGRGSSWGLGPKATRLQKSVCVCVCVCVCVVVMVVVS